MTVKAMPFNERSIPFQTEADALLECRLWVQVPTLNQTSDRIGILYESENQRFGMTTCLSETPERLPSSPRYTAESDSPQISSYSSTSIATG